MLQERVPIQWLACDTANNLENIQSSKDFCFVRRQLRRAKQKQCDDLFSHMARFEWMK